MEKVKLNQLAKIYNGNSINAKTKADKYSAKVEGYSYVGTKDIARNGVVTYDTGVIIPFQEKDFKIAPANCVLVCSEGGSAGKKTAYNSKDICFGNKLYAITNDKGLFNAKYVYYFSRYQDFFHQFKGLMNGIIGGVSAKKFGEITIPLPETVEAQEKIVQKIEELFSELDKGIEELTTAKARLKVYRQAVLDSAFLDIENSTETTLINAIVAKPRNGFSPKGVEFETKYKNLTLTATTGGKFKENYYKFIDIDIDDDSYLWVMKNDILIQRGNTIDYVGTAAIYQGEDRQYVYPDIMMKIKVTDPNNPMFILYQLQSGKIKQYFRKNATGTAGNMPKIKQGTVMDAPIVLVDTEQQEQIVLEIESRLSICDQIEATIEESLKKAESLRQSILKEAFEGRLI